MVEIESRSKFIRLPRTLGKRVFVTKILLIAASIAYAVLKIGLAHAQAPCPFQIMTQQWSQCNSEWQYTCVQICFSCHERAVCEAQLYRKYTQVQETKGPSPSAGLQCPASHPIKGNFTTYNGERCIYHIPGSEFYDATKPERCYATPRDAVADGCRASLK